MLVHLLPEQVNTRWEFFAPMIGKSLPPMIASSVKGMSNVLAAVLREDLDVWVYKEEDEAIFITSTTVHTDIVTGKRFLLIYSLTGIREIKPRMWEDAYETLSKHAKSLNCEGIIAYSDEQSIINFVRGRGAKADFTLIEMEV